jgi:GNAT superfamily N-acetyltransferase
MINIVRYEEDFDAILKEFEYSSATEIGEDFPLCYIKSSTKFNFRFSSKGECYKNFEIFLGVDKVTQEVLATLILAAKTFEVGGVSLKTMQITAVKVHPEVRRSGVATALLKFAEKKAIKMGVTSLVAKINHGNIAAGELFVKKFLFREVSSVKMVTFQKQEKVGNKDVKLLSKEEGLRRTQEFFCGKDYFPDDFEKIFTSGAYLGTFLISNENEWISASLWNSSYYSELEVSQVLIDKRFLVDNKLYARVVSLLLLVIAGYFYICKAIYYYFTEKAYQITFFSVFFLLSIFLFQWVSVIYKYFKQARRKEKPRLKIFGVCYNNSIDRKRPSLKNLFQFMSSSLENEYTSFEFHENDIYDQIFPDYSFRKAYLQKSLKNSLIFNWNKRHFVDPRE